MMATLADTEKKIAVKIKTLALAEKENEKFIERQENKLTKQKKNYRETFG